jgi:hypothetical protein
MNNPIEDTFNRAFGNCIFMSRQPKDIETTLMERITEHQVMEIPTKIVVTPVDDLHDRLSLSLLDGNVDGVLTWRKSTTGVHYVLEAEGFSLLT